MEGKRELVSQLIEEGTLSVDKGADILGITIKELETYLLQNEHKIPQKI